MDPFTDAAIIGMAAAEAGGAAAAEGAATAGAEVGSVGAGLESSAGAVDEASGGLDPKKAAMNFIQPREKREGGANGGGIGGAFNRFMGSLGTGN